MVEHGNLDANRNIQIQQYLNTIIKDFMDKVINQVLKMKEEDFVKMRKLPKTDDQMTQRDLKLLDEAIKQYMGRRIPSHIFRLLLAQQYNKSGDQRSLGYVLDVNFPQLEKAGFINEARIIISETLIKHDQFMRAHTIQKYLQELDKAKFLEEHDEMKGRIQAIRAGYYLLRCNFFQSSLCYFNTCRENYFLQREKQRLQLMEMAIGMAFISPKNADLHKLVCTLYISDLAKRTQLFPLLQKLYSESMVHQQDLNLVRKFLPKRVDDKDSDNISIMQKATFAHNMLAIIKCFSKVSLETLSKMIQIGQDEMLLMIEKTYRKGQVKVDQISGFLEIMENESDTEMITKRWFDKVDEVLASK